MEVNNRTFKVDDLLVGSMLEKLVSFVEGKEFTYMDFKYYTDSATYFVKGLVNKEKSRDIVSFGLSRYKDESYFTKYQEDGDLIVLNQIPLAAIADEITEHSLFGDKRERYLNEDCYLHYAKSSMVIGSSSKSIYKLQATPDYQMGYINEFLNYLAACIPVGTFEITPSWANDRIKEFIVARIDLIAQKRENQVLKMMEKLDEESELRWKSFSETQPMPRRIYAKKNQDR